MAYCTRSRAPRDPGRAARWLTAALLVATAAACGVERREARETRPAATRDEPAPAEAGAEAFAWPRPDAERPVAVLEVEGFGRFRIALYPELAPESAALFARRIDGAYYEGTTFHRVVPDFVVQGGDPNSRDDDPANDGRGGLEVTLPDEHSDAPLERGTVALANQGQPGTSGAQFFVALTRSPALDGRYNVIGRVIDGMDVVDAVAAVETDVHGRWSPRNRPLQDVVIARTRLETARAPAGRSPSRKP